MARSAVSGLSSHPSGPRSSLRCAWSAGAEGEYNRDPIGAASRGEWVEANSAVGDEEKERAGRREAANGGGRGTAADENVSEKANDGPEGRGGGTGEALVGLTGGAGVLEEPVEGCCRARCHLGV